MSYLDLLSWAGCIFLLYGLKLIGDKKRLGFYIALWAEFLWIVWGLITHAHALVAMSVVITLMYVRAIWLWGKDETV